MNSGIRNIQLCFANHFYPPNMNLRFFLSEIDSFIVFLENNKKLGTNLIRLRSNIDANYMTITQRLRSLFKYFVYLLDEYWNTRYQDITIKELTNRRKKIDLFLLNKKRIFSKFSKHSLTVKSEINHNFKSLTNEMVAMLYKIIRPDQSAKINIDNPPESLYLDIKLVLIVTGT